MPSPQVVQNEATTSPLNTIIDTNGQQILQFAAVSSRLPLVPASPFRDGPDLGPVLLPSLNWKLSENPNVKEERSDQIKAIRDAGSKELGISWLRTALIDTEHLWFLAPVGGFSSLIPITQAYSPTNYLVNAYREGTMSSPLIIPNMKEDDRFSRHPLVRQRPHLKFCAVAPITSVFNGHCMGVLLLSDYLTKGDLSEEQRTRIAEMARELAIVLQQDIIELVGGKKDQNGSYSGLDSLGDPPSVIFDASTPTWDIMDANAPWEMLVGSKSATLQAIGGLLDLIESETDADFDSLVSSIIDIDQSGKHLPKYASLPAIMRPTDILGAGLQLVVSFRPIEKSHPAYARNATGSKMWLAEVHAVGYKDCPGMDPKNSFQLSASRRKSVDSISLGSNASSLADFSGTTASGVLPNNSGKLHKFLTGPLLSLDPPPQLPSLQIGRRLGQGSSASVYSGMYNAVPVAVKIIQTPSGATNVMQQWQGRTEAGLSVELQHANVIKTLAWGFNEINNIENVFIVQELSDSGSLSAALDDGRLRIKSAGDSKPNMRIILETALDISKGMEYLHAHNVLHADLSANNVLILSSESYSKGFVAKVTDFGLSRASNKTFTSKTSGTVTSAAPEVLMDNISSRSGDVYSFGVLLWEMYAGAHAWKGSSFAQIVFQMTVKCQGLVVHEDAPEDYARLAKACMAFIKMDRPTFKQITTKLEAMIVALPPQAILE